MVHSDSLVPDLGLVRRRLLQGVLSGTVLAVAESLRPNGAIAAELPTSSPPSGNPKAGGFSANRFKKLTQGLAAYVDHGEIAGFTTLIHRHGEIAHMDIVGWQDQEGKVPLKRDTIFRIASMSKPITSVATLMLLEDGKFRLEDPIDRWLPEFANRKVLRNPAGAIDDTYPSPRPITVGDLLTQRPGIASHFDSPSTAVTALLTDLGSASGVDDWLKKLGQVPLLYPPGERFIYGYSMDVLGALVARASGMSFPDFLQTRLFGPLGMNDTAFWVPEAKLPRLSAGYTWDAKTGTRTIFDPVTKSKFGVAPKVPSGAGGLVSTADDFLKFGVMLLRNGIAGDTRILSRKTVELMTSDFLTPEQRRMPFFYDADFWRGQGYGLGVSVVDNVAGRGEPGSVGQYGWNGAYGTLWLNDPREDMSAILMIQTMYGETSPRIQRVFRTLVYQAIDD
jgi:CubicO group peptidase (beta-lactamase class C family)